ncbi:MAG: F/Y-rich N-terminus-domain-containing protein, partial [Olpidium bornovanus]
SESRARSPSAWSPPPPRQRRRTHETGDGDGDRRQLDGPLKGKDGTSAAAEGPLLLPCGGFSDAPLAKDHAAGGRFTREGSASTGRTEREDHPSAGAPRPRHLKRKNPGTPRRVHDYPRDEHGRPILPIRIGTVNIHALGRIDTPFRDNFHNERYIYPENFQSSRQYMSMVDPNGTATYVSTVAEEKGEPRFIVRADDQPDRVFQAKSPTGAWTPIVRGANAIRNREHSNSANGPDLFGFSLPQVALMFVSAPGKRVSSARDGASATCSFRTPERCEHPVKEEPERKVAPWPSTPADADRDPSSFSAAEKTPPAACPGPLAKRRRKASASSSGKAGDPPSSSAGSKKAKKKSAKKENAEAGAPIRPEAPPPPLVAPTALSHPPAPFSAVLLPAALFPAAPPAPAAALQFSRERSPPTPPGAVRGAAAAASADLRGSPSDHVVLKHLIHPGNSAVAPPPPPVGGAGAGAPAAYGVEDADVTEDEEV